ncbi:MAG TPA: peptidoglycan DD-metalloendopeptidase family protein [Gammaproteobacteria bacterium]
MTRFLFCLLLYSFSFNLHAQASGQDTGNYQIKLDQIREKITGVLNRLNENQSKRDDIRTELQSLEVKIAKISRSLRNTQQKHKKSTQHLAELKSDLIKLRQKLGSQRELLANQIRSAYAMGQQPQIKLLLNQQDSAEMGRAMVYFDYLNKARSREIQDYLNNIQQKQQLETNIASTAKELEVLVKKQLDQKEELTRFRGDRKQLLARLNKDIEGQQLTLKDLENSRSRIEQLLMSLGELLADIPAAPETQQPFSQLKGKLPWPTKGSLAAQFGASRHQGDLKWNGVLINAAYGTPVRVITHGRVAFADWLQGFGFITIIDHNDGYMSLYGHNQAQYKQAGDWVEPGEVIATVGDSGGQENTGLYFEIRYQGKPVNPTQWCSSSVRHVALQDP